MVFINGTVTIRPEGDCWYTIGGRCYRVHWEVDNDFWVDTGEEEGTYTDKGFNIFFVPQELF